MSLRVLLADTHAGRCAALRDTLAAWWGAEVEVARTGPELLTAIQRGRAGDRPVDFVLIAFGFDGFRHLPLLRELELHLTPKGVLMDSLRDRPLPLHFHGALLWAEEDLIAGDPRLRERLPAVIGPIPPRLPVLCNEADLSEALASQIEQLADKGGLAAGLLLLRQLVCQLESELDSFELLPVGQGFSGAQVFRIRFGDPAASGQRIERVLKLTREADRHRCDHELRHYPGIAAQLGDGVVPCVPAIHGVRTGIRGSAQSTGPAECTNWVAVAYTFLRSDGYPIVDFAKAYLETHPVTGHLELPEARSGGATGVKILPQVFLDSLFRQLAQWYAKDCRRCSGPLWSFERTAEDRPPRTFPPYRFSAWERRTIKSSLQALEPYGPSLLPAEWEACRGAALDCIATTAPAGFPSRLRDGVAYFVAPVHGDMNASNIMLATVANIPFLIDFACHQTGGHAVQDFARLELAIKLELMACELHGAPRGRDLNLELFDAWCAAERWLSSLPASGAALPERVKKVRCVARAYELCRFVRHRAFEIHQQLNAGGDASVDFQLSYRAALLYHTVRALRYVTLPHLKRVFAVFSIAQLYRAI